jgi:LmbE family N-acetylglucosaminyl deacetylase
LSRNSENAYFSHGLLSLEEFAAVRRHELEGACAALGIHTPLFLACADQQLARNCWEAATEESARIIARLMPDIVITFGPDGVSGHPDHVALSTIVTRAFQTASEGSTTADGNKRAFRPKALYYVLGPASVPQSCTPAKPIVPPIVTTVIDLRESGERKFAAAQCYGSQRHLLPTDSTGIAAIQEEPERFHRAFPPWTGTQPEDELLNLTRLDSASGS